MDENVKNNREYNQKGKMLLNVVTTNKKFDRIKLLSEGIV